MSIKTGARSPIPCALNLLLKKPCQAGNDPWLTFQYINIFNYLRTVP